MTVIYKTLSILILLITKLLLVETNSSVNLNKCYNRSRDFHPYLGSTTPYEFVHGNITRPKDCTPLQVWMTARHGARYPNIPEQQLVKLEEFRDQIILNFKQGKGQLCFNDLENFRLWQRNPNFYNLNKSNLAPEGMKEIYQFAQRLKSVFPELLNSNEPLNYRFLATKYERSNRSLESFATALFGMNKKIECEKDEIKNGRNCLKWVKNLAIDELLKERDKFIEAPAMRQVLKNVTIRLGFLETLDYDKVRLMYEVCRYEIALNPKTIGTWCHVFNKEELRLFEYLEDLDYFYVHGPGNKMTRVLNCGLIKKLFENFENIESGLKTNQPKGIFNFGHSANIQSLLTLLRIYDGEKPLLASNFKYAGGRRYRISIMGPFASNVVAVFYKCNVTTSPHKVAFYVAENEISMPGCNGELCDWNYLKQEFRSIIRQCDLNFCNKPLNAAYASASNTFANGYILYLFFTIFNILRYP